MVGICFFLVLLGVTQESWQILVYFDGLSVEDCPTDRDCFIALGALTSKCQIPRTIRSVSLSLYVYIYRCMHVMYIYIHKFDVYTYIYIYIYIYIHNLVVVLVSNASF